MGFQSVLARMHNRLIARLGDPAVLRGSEPCLANVEYSVSVTFANGDDKFALSEYATVVDVANILSILAPKPGDTLAVGEIVNDVFVATKTYTIDAIAADNGHMARCVLR